MPPGPETGLSPLLIPEPSRHEVDVVFVHGLNGHRSASWTNQASELWPLWLRDLQTARAWTYGYDASIWVRSQDSIEIHSIRFLESLVDKGVGICSKSGLERAFIPIIFIAHSLGGILIKTAMYEAHFPNKAYSYIFCNTIGVVFLGTPHRGSQWANRLAIAQLGITLFLAQTELVRQLRSKSGDLATISERFNNVWGTKHVLCCYEKRRTLGVGKIVRRQDAVTNCMGEKIVEIDADHRGIAKPLSRNTLLYQTIVEFLNKCQARPAIVSDDDPHSNPMNTQSISSLQAPTDSVDSNSNSEKPLTREQKTRRKIVRQVLWNQVHGATNPGLDEWICIAEEWSSDDKQGQQAHWLGGVYLCRFLPTVGDTTIQIEIDVTEELCPVMWVIQVGPDSPFYPGRHAGRLEFSLAFPTEQIYVVWLTPIFSPFVRFTRGTGEVSSPFDLGKWSPYYTVQHVLQTIANFLALDPLCRTKPPLDHGALTLPWKFSDLSNVVSYTKNEDAFFHAAQFFSRAYNRVSRQVDNPPVLDSQRQASITAIKELVDFYLCGIPPLPKGRTNSNYVDAFNDVLTNNEWIAEEKVWADAISASCGFQFVEE